MAVLDRTRLTGQLFLFFLQFAKPFQMNLKTDEFYSKADELIAAGRFIDSKGWVPATSGNFSARLSDGNIAITVSGRHKGQLQCDDIMLIDTDGLSLDGKKTFRRNAIAYSALSALS
jgi:ribulose-5-phosphate 4-epimerase/fuculose-1-phosphate aldolase